MARNKPFLVAPSLLSADFSRLAEEIHAVEQAGADWLHLDVMDGHFVPNLTFGPPVVKSLRPVTTKTFDVHLMIESPEKYLEDFIRAGADYLTIHVEATSNPAELLNEIRRNNVKAGLTLRPGTPVDSILPFLSQVDLVLVMTVEPGFGGQKFMQDQVPKIEKLRQEIDKKNLSTLIEVDGGISAETALFCKEADVLVAGSYIFKSKDYSQAIQMLKEIR